MDQHSIKKSSNMPNELTKSQARTSKEPTFSVDIINMIIKEADRFGIDPEWIYEKVGFDPDILQIPNGRLSVPQVNDMMNETIKS
jgi:hypothetical protein